MSKKDTRHICDVFREEFLEPNDITRIVAVRAMKMSNTVYSHTAAGKQMPSVTFFSKIAHYTNTDVSFWIEQHARWTEVRCKDLLAELTPRPCFENGEVTVIDPPPYTKRDLVIFDMNANVKEEIRKLSVNRVALKEHNLLFKRPNMLKE